MRLRYKHLLILLLCTLFVLPDAAEARRRRRRRYQGPPPTSPVVLWAKTLSESDSLDERRKAAFKLSHYTQALFQQEVIKTLLTCIKDPDVQIKVLCVKATRNAGKSGHNEVIQNALLDVYKTDPFVRSTVVRTLIARRDDSQVVQDTLLEGAKTATDVDDLLAILSYFELFGSGSNSFVNSIAAINNTNTKVRIAIAKVLGERGKSQDQVINLLTQYTESRDTPLVLTALAGLQQQARKDARAMAAAQKTIESGDPDVVLATLDLITTLPDSPNALMTKRLLEIIRSDDESFQEKAILALGVCGDYSDTVLKQLESLLKEPKTPEPVRIAAALVLGKQGVRQAEDIRPFFTKCLADAPSQTLKTACEIGLNELKTHKPPANLETPVAKSTEKAEKAPMTPDSDTTPEASPKPSPPTEEPTTSQRGIGPKN